MTKRLVTIIIAVNILTGLLMFLSSEYAFWLLRGLIIENVGVFTIQQGFQETFSHDYNPLPNFPFFMFLISLSLNIYFLIKLRKNKEATDQ